MRRSTPILSGARLCLVVLVFAYVSHGWSQTEPDPVFSIGAKGHSSKVFSRSQLEDRFSSQEKELIVVNPAYKGEQIGYVGVELKQIFDLINLGRSIEEYQVIVNCTDGYRPILDGAIFKRPGAFFAYREVEPDKELASEDGLWTKVKMGEEYVSPGPFYIVWTHDEHYPNGWPFQIASILFVLKSEFDEYEPLVPRGEVSASVFRGFDQFQKHCLVCHSLNCVGAKGRAPDLGSLFGYRTDEQVRDVIRRGQGTMPAYPESQLTSKDLEGLVDYLRQKQALQAK